MAQHDFAARGYYGDDLPLADDRLRPLLSRCRGLRRAWPRPHDGRARGGYVRGRVGEGARGRQGGTRRCLWVCRVSQRQRRGNIRRGTAGDQEKPHKQRCLPHRNCGFRTGPLAVILLRARRTPPWAESWLSYGDEMLSRREMLTWHWMAPGHRCQFFSFSMATMAFWAGSMVKRTVSPALRRSRRDGGVTL